MEIFDDETYDIMEKEYQKALSLSVQGGLMRAIKGEIPFRLSESREYEDLLIDAAKLNKRLKSLCSLVAGFRGEILIKLLEKNEIELPAVAEEENVIEIKKYENPCIKIGYGLICKLEEAREKGAKITTTLCRTYALTSAFFGM